MGSLFNQGIRTPVELIQSYSIYKQKFSRTKDGGGAPATSVPFSFRIAIGGKGRRSICHKLKDLCLIKS